MQRHPGSDPCLDDPVDQSLVEVETFLVHGSGPLRQDPGPGNRQTVGIEAEFLHQGYVARPPVVVIAGHIAPVGQPALIGKGVPDRLALAVGSASFYLEGGSLGPPNESRWKAHHSILRGTRALTGRAAGFRRFRMPRRASPSRREPGRTP